MPAGAEDTFALLLMHARPADIESVCSALATCVFRDALHELLIKPGCTTHVHGPDSDPHEPFPQGVLTPLLALGSLQKLFLKGPCFSSLHDATLAAMVRAFPNLWAAMFCPDAAPNQGATLAGLGVLVGLKELRSVHVPLSHVDERALADAFSRLGQREALPSSLPPGPSPSGGSASAAHGFSAPALPVTAVSAPSRPDSKPCAEHRRWARAGLRGVRRRRGRCALGVVPVPHVREFYRR